MTRESYHEPLDKLREETKDLHRAITSLMEELEAVDWYQQRIDACQDDELRQILIHNRDEEKEHAAMVIEWLRRHDEGFARELKTYLFTDRPLGYDADAHDDAPPRAEPAADGGASHDDEAPGDRAMPRPASRRLTVGPVRGGR